MSASQDAIRRYVAESRVRLQQLLDRLQWTAEGVQRQHRGATAGKNLKTEQQPLSNWTAEAAYCVQFSDSLLQQLLPSKNIESSIQSFDDLQSNYSSSEKLTLYENVLKRTPRQLCSLQDTENLAQLVAATQRSQQQQRQQQRRHRKCKATQREQLHQLVELQMQALIKQRLEDAANSSREKHENRRQPYRELRSRSPSGKQRSPSRKQRSRSPRRNQRSHIRRQRSCSKEHRSRSREHHNRRRVEHSRSRERRKRHKCQRKRSRSRSLSPSFHSRSHSRRH